MDTRKRMPKKTYIKTIILLVILAALISWGFIFQTYSIPFVDSGDIALSKDSKEDIHIPIDEDGFTSYEKTDNRRSENTSDGIGQAFLLMAIPYVLILFVLGSNFTDYETLCNKLKQYTLITLKVRLDN